MPSPPVNTFMPWTHSHRAPGPYPWVLWLYLNILLLLGICLCQWLYMPDSIYVCVHPCNDFPSLSSELQPARNLQTINEGKRSISYVFAASPTSGVIYKVTFTPLIAGIPTPQTETFRSAGLQTTSRLTPDVTYRLQVFAVLNGMESAAISVNVTTLPAGKAAINR